MADEHVDPHLRLVQLHRASIRYLHQLEERITRDPTLALEDGERWLPADLEFARRFAQQYAGPGVPTIESIHEAIDEIQLSLDEYENNHNVVQLNNMSRRIWLYWRTMGKKDFWNKYGPGSKFSLNKCDIPPKPIEVPSDEAPYSVYEDDWKEMNRDFPSSGVDWNLVTRFNWTDDDKTTLTGRRTCTARSRIFYSMGWNRR